MSERRRAGEARQSMRRGMTVPPRPTPQPVPDDDTVPTAEEGGQAKPAPDPAGARSAREETTKSTPTPAADTPPAFDARALAARRKLGRRVDKSEVMKALIRLAADD